MATAPALDLPPPFRLVTLREVGDAMAHATEIAAEEGAGTLVHVGRFDLAEFAVVLEPDEPLWQARRAIYAGAAALADALAVHAPPEKPIAFDWPDAIRVDGGLVGGVRLEWPVGADENEPRAVAGVRRDDPHRRAWARRSRACAPLSAALEDEGFDGLGSGRLVESFARHLMSAIDAWQEKGFGEIEKNYLARLAPESGVRRQIDENGDLLVRRMAAAEPVRHSLVERAVAGVVARSRNRRAAQVKLLRTIRLDPSDTFVFERAAEPGEWAVSGAFMFWDGDPATMEGKERAAFRSGFLGVQSLGWSTLVQIVEASDDDRLAAIDTLARHLVAEFGAPSVADAVAAAEEEFAFAASLCDHPLDMLVAVHRTVENGEIREAFRTLRPRGERKPMRAFSFLEVEGEEEPAETVDLAKLAKGDKS